jgi:predicted N-acetyltransferase YhbS
MPDVLEVIESANSHLHQRLNRFRSAGGGWFNATAMVWEEAGHVQSVALIFRRDVWSAAGTVTFGGIGAVATRPRMQGRRLASAVLEACERQLAEAGYRVAVLFCSIAPFYERLGWAVVPIPPLAIPRPEADPSLRFELVSVSAVAREIRELYEKCAAGAILRPPELWRDYNTWLREDEDLFQAAYADDQLLGYARARRCTDGLELLEATGGALPALLFELLRCAGRQRFLSPTTVMMTKPLAASRTSNFPTLLETDFEGGLPWAPRIWWPIDRF